MSLVRDRNFRAMWIGQTVSDVGSQVTVLVLPLLAITTLGAGTAEVGVLRACAAAAVLVGAIPAGVIVDRARKRVVMQVSNLGRAAVVGSVPLLALFDAVTMAQLYIVAFAGGVLGIAFSVAYHAYYPRFVAKEDLPDANAKIGATESFARVSGPGIGAGLASLIGAAATMLLDALSYLVSVVSLGLIRGVDDEPRPAAATRPRLRDEAREGFRLVVGNAVLARTALTTIAWMFCFTMTDAVFIYFLVHDLDLSAWLVGVVFVVGELGGLAAALLATRVMRRVGSARVMWLMVFLTPAGYLCAVAYGPGAIVLTCLFVMLSAARFVLFDIAQYSYRQLACPLHKLGKVTASIRLGIGLAAAVGALTGGLLGEVIGTRATIALATTLACAAGLPVLFSALHSTRDIGDLPVLQDTEAPTTAR